MAIMKMGFPWDEMAQKGLGAGLGSEGTGGNGQDGSG